MNKTKSAPRKRGAERQSESGGGGEERKGKNIVRRRIIGSVGRDASFKGRENADGRRADSI